MQPKSTEICQASAYNLALWQKASHNLQLVCAEHGVARNRVCAVAWCDAHSIPCFACCACRATVQVACGLNFTVALTRNGEVLQMGRTGAENNREHNAMWEVSSVALAVLFAMRAGLVGP